MSWYNSDKCKHLFQFCINQYNVKMKQLNVIDSISEYIKIYKRMQQINALQKTIVQNENFKTINQIDRQRFYTYVRFEQISVNVQYLIYQKDLLKYFCFLYQTLIIFNVR
ncbi:hypothetical protein TTHERM_000449789 (macronuclear) [Tetrahymena thermophila SB210]|uniref:Uncharacterized protein n=1 Tax=Tetrahymena thermophila (strain SB210) TaxID=312017 RepID=W7XJ06_TETTS|nr:hypothetical protein TTHERM_000449789 [Tetrahymena thermophila SB210]EWS75081.1 hypothetical protein TTHERM_000449789 [Tetrahymena thermophila SB210]|eukprot:XP_012652394.1 hypothetical protein TTHERM_000449789 [Tetrahymena thermophila SB210]